MTVSKTVRGGSSPSRDAKIWADSDNGSTVALQASGRGSIPRRSTKSDLDHVVYMPVSIMDGKGVHFITRKQLGEMDERLKSAPC